MLIIYPILKDIHFFDSLPVGSKTDFCISAVLDIGYPEQEGADQFYATIATTTGLRDFFSKEQIVLCRGVLILDTFDLQLIKEKIQSIIELCAKEDWPQTAISINKLFPWEFDDIKWE